MSRKLDCYDTVCSIGSIWTKLTGEIRKQS